MKAGVVIDPWKLEIFKRHLDKAGFEYEVTKGKRMTVLTVTTEYAHTLQPVVEEAQRECDKVER